MGYISRLAGVLLWVLGLIITSTVLYLVYWVTVRYVSSFAAGVIAALLVLAGLAILVFWGSVLLRGVSAR